MGSPFALATSSCTGALTSALVACGVGPGDEVIVSGYTFFASCATIVAAKAIPVIEKKASSDVCCPWECPYHEKKNPKPVEYDANMNPKTLEYLGRVVHLDIPPQMTEEDCDMIAKAINKVAAVLA